MSAILTLARNAEDGAHSYLMGRLKVDVNKRYTREENEQRTGIWISEE